MPLPSQPLQPDDAHTDSSGGGTHSINARAHAPTLAIAKKWRSKVKWDQLSKPREERPQNPYQGSKPELPEPVSAAGVKGFGYRGRGARVERAWRGSAAVVEFRSCW